MLILIAKINNDIIDQIYIQNCGQYAGDFWRYRLVKPKGHDGPTFLHRRSSGWRPLAEKVLHYLNKVEPTIDIEGERRAKQVQRKEQS